MLLRIKFAHINVCPSKALWQYEGRKEVKDGHKRLEDKLEGYHKAPAEKSCQRCTMVHFVGQHS